MVQVLDMSASEWGERPCTAEDGQKPSSAAPALEGLGDPVLSPGGSWPRREGLVQDYIGKGPGLGDFWRPDSPALCISGSLCP